MFLNHFLLLLCYSCPKFSPFALFHPAPSTPKVNPHTIVHVCGSFIHVLCLVPSPSFHHYLPPPSPLAALSLFHVSMPLVLFCSLVYFVH